MLGLERRLRSNGQFALDAGEPVNNRDVFRDEMTGEVIRLWRTPTDVAKQLKYKRYRKAVRLGFKAIMRDEMPELFATNTREKGPRMVRAYALPKLISTGLTTLTCGGGVTIKTGIQPIDVLIADLKLEEKVQQWSWQASVYSFVGIKLTIDPQEESLTMTRVWPDHLYLHRDDNDDVEYISQKTWMPLESIAGWEPIRMNTQDSIGVMRSVTRSRRNGINIDNGDWVEIGQDGFILEERHYRGWIEYHFFAVSGDRILSTVPLSVYSKVLAKQPVYFTGMPDFAITVFPNVGLGDDIPVSDWDDLVDETMDFNVRATKNSRLVDRYSHPREMVPASHIQVDPITGKAQWGMGDSDVIVMRGSDTMKPELLQPNANFDAPEKDLEFARSMIGLMGSARHLVDPEILEQVDSGVSLKLKMAPAMAKVEPRRSAQVEAIKTILINVISGLEFASSRRKERSADAYDKFEFGAERLAGPLRSALSELTTDVTDATGDPLRKLSMQEGKIDVSALLPHVKHIDIDSGTEIVEKQERAARAMFLTMPDTMKSVSFVDSATTFEEDGQRMVPGQQVGMNMTESVEAPDDLELEDLQYAVDSMFDAEKAVGRDSFTVRMMPGMPQDHAEANTRVVDGTMSLYRFLRDYDGMTEIEAKEEIERINDQTASSASDDLFDDQITDSANDPLDPDGLDGPVNLSGPMPSEQQARSFMLGLSGDAALDPTMVESTQPPRQDGVNDQNDEIGTSLQTRPHEM